MEVDNPLFVEEIGFHPVGPQVVPAWPSLFSTPVTVVGRRIHGRTEWSGHGCPKRPRKRVGHQQVKASDHCLKCRFLLEPPPLTSLDLKKTPVRAAVDQAAEREAKVIEKVGPQDLNSQEVLGGEHQLRTEPARSWR